MAGFHLSFVPKGLVFFILFTTYIGTCLANKRPKDPKSEVVVAISGCVKICETSKSAVTQLLKTKGSRKLDVIFLKGCGSALDAIKQDLRKTIPLVQLEGGGDVSAKVQSNPVLKGLIDNALSLLNACDSNNKGLDPQLTQILNHEISLRLKGSIAKAFGLDVHSIKR